MWDIQSPLPSSAMGLMLQGWSLRHCSARRGRLGPAAGLGLSLHAWRRAGAHPATALLSHCLSTHPLTEHPPKSRVFIALHSTSCRHAAWAQMGHDGWSSSLPLIPFPPHHRCVCGEGLITLWSFGCSKGRSGQGGPWMGLEQGEMVEHGLGHIGNEGPSGAMGGDGHLPVTKPLGDTWGLTHE